jgi:hypothetical protein
VLEENDKNYMYEKGEVEDYAPIKGCLDASGGTLSIMRLNLRRNTAEVTPRGCTISQ